MSHSNFRRMSFDIRSYSSIHIDLEQLIVPVLVPKIYLSCKWFPPSDPINEDVLTNGRCVHPELKNLIISGRDWCNQKYK